MKRLLLLFFTLSLLTTGAIGLSTRHVAAVDVIDPACQNADQNNLPAVCKDNQTNTKDNNNPIFGNDGLVTKGLQILVIIIGITSVIVIIISGIRLEASGGNPESAGKARKGIIYAITGLVIAVLAQAIVSFVLSKL